MKIEKLSKENIKEFIRDMKLDNNEIDEFDINKSELYGIKNNDLFCLGFNSLASVDTIALLYFASKMSNELFYECVDFLNRSLVVENHLIIKIYNEKYMNLLDDRYKCREILVSLNLKDNSDKYYVDTQKSNLKEKFIDIEMKSIKYNYCKEVVYCNLVKQNIQDEKLIYDLNKYFINLDVNFINFTIYNESLNFFRDYGYKCIFKSYVIRND